MIPAKHENHDNRPRGFQRLSVLVIAASMIFTVRVAAQTFKVLYAFHGAGDGGRSFAGLVQDSSGNLYGTTSKGGAHGYGVVFRLDTSGHETVLHSFAGPPSDGANPEAGLVRDTAGNLYGTTPYGGSSGYGTVFEVDAAGNESVLYSFAGGTDGANPYGGLLRDSAGVLYGTTANGGDTSSECDFGTGCGTAFKLDASGTKTMIYTFRPKAEGRRPYSALLGGDTTGNLYGTTRDGDGFGTVFELEPSGYETVLYHFNGYDGDGSVLYSGVVRDTEGNLYGTTWDGGPYGPYAGRGVIFKVDMQGNETLLHAFAGPPSDGSHPYGGLVRDSLGNLYGTTYLGGSSGGFGFGEGVVFELDASGNETILHNFTGGADGKLPYAEPISDSAGNLYGTTSAGGAYGGGVVFEITPSSQ